MNRIKDQIEKIFITKQAGFETRKACTGQVLNLCQHIVDDFKRKRLLGRYYTDHPMYLGVILNRTLKFKEHHKKTKVKIQIRNNLLRKLVGNE